MGFDLVIEMARVVALTGATGFIGRVVARRLRCAGWTVRALVRTSPNRVPHPLRDCAWVEGDLTEPRGLSRFVAGANAIVHCAGVVRGVSRAQFNCVNVDGVAHLVRAAVRAEPAPRFLLISSLAAKEPHLSLYAASKRGGEEVLEAQELMKWAAFRPPAVYGPGDRELLPLLRWASRGMGFRVGRGERRFSLLYVEDLAEAVCRWLDSHPEGSSIYELDDGHKGGYTWDDVIDTIEGLCNRHVFRVNVPIAALFLAAVFNGLAGRLLGHSPMLTRGKFREITHPDWCCNNGPITAECGWTPRVSLKEGLRRTLEIPPAPLQRGNKGA
jgi:nucleoside-diphosphate-sugar epimerase